MESIDNCNCTTNSHKRLPNDKYQGALKIRLRKMSAAEIKVNVGSKEDKVTVSINGKKAVFGLNKHISCLSNDSLRAGIFDDYIMAVMKQIGAKVNDMISFNITPQKGQRKQSSVVKSHATNVTTSENPSGDDDGGGGDSDPDQPPRPYCLSSPPHLTNPQFIKQNSFRISRCLTSCSCSMAGGGQA